MSFFLYAICDDAPLFPNNYSRYSSLFSSWTSPHNMAPMKRLSTSLYLYFPLFVQKSSSPRPLFQIYCNTHSSRYFWQSYCCFYFNFYCCPPQQSEALWPYLSQLLHSTLNNLPFLLLLFFYPVFNDRTFSSDSYFSCVFIPFSYVLQDQHISLLKYLDSIFVMLMFQDTLDGLYYSGKT